MSLITAVFNFISWNVASFLHCGWVFVPWVRPHWFTKDMKNQNGKVVVITGANSGTGYATAKAYYERGATVYMLCRSEERAEAAMADIKRGGNVDITGKMVYTPADLSNAGSMKFVPLDLADLDSVEAAARDIAARTDRIDVLFANAGIMAIPAGSRTKQGYPLQFGTNETSRKTGRPSRLISLSSAAHSAAPKGGINYASLEPGAPFLQKWVEYGESKWGNAALAMYVDAHYGPKSAAGSGEVIAVAVHPGVVATNLFAHNRLFSFLAHHLSWVLGMITAVGEVGALNQLWAAEVDDDAARKLSGKYVWCYQVAGEPRPDLLDTAAVDRLWEWCEAQRK